MNHEQLTYLLVLAELKSDFVFEQTIKSCTICDIEHFNFGISYFYFTFFSTKIIENHHVVFI